MAYGVGGYGRGGYGGMVTGVYVLPIVGSGAEWDPRRPKYLYEPADEDQYPMGPPLRDVVQSFHGSEAITKDGSDYMAAVVETDTQSALDTLSGQADAYPIDGPTLADALNATGTFPVDLTPREWALVVDRLWQVVA